MGSTGRAAVLALSAGLLSGCTALQQQPEARPDPLAVTVRACLAQNRLFIDAWGCVQNKDLLDQIGGEPDRRKRILKLGDALAAEVAAKSLSSAAAAKRLGAGLAAEAPT